MPCALSGSASSEARRSSSSTTVVVYHPCNHLSSRLLRGFVHELGYIGTGTSVIVVHDYGIEVYHARHICQGILCTESYLRLKSADKKSSEVILLDSIV